MSEQICHAAVFKLPVTQTETDNIYDSSGESLSRVMTEFDKENNTKKKVRRIEIGNRDTFMVINSIG